jgi:hypothetical protein
MNEVETDVGIASNLTFERSMALIYLGRILLTIEEDLGLAFSF